MTRRLREVRSARARSWIEYLESVQNRSRSSRIAELARQSLHRVRNREEDPDRVLLVGRLDKLKALERHGPMHTLTDRERAARRIAQDLRNEYGNGCRLAVEDLERRLESESGLPVHVEIGACDRAIRHEVERLCRESSGYEGLTKAALGNFAPPRLRGPALVSLIAVALAGVALAYFWTRGDGEGVSAAASDLVAVTLWSPDGGRVDELTPQGEVFITLDRATAPGGTAAGGPLYIYAFNCEQRGDECDPLKRVYPFGRQLLGDSPPNVLKAGGSLRLPSEEGVFAVSPRDEKPQQEVVYIVLSPTQVTWLEDAGQEFFSGVELPTHAGDSSYERISDDDAARAKELIPQEVGSEPGWILKEQIPLNDMSAIRLRLPYADSR